MLDVGGPNIEEWDKLPCRLHRPTQRLLEMLQKTKTPATFFVLGWVAEKYPQLVKKIAEAGFEIGSHGYAHKLVYQQTPEEFRADIRASVDSIATACGLRPTAYRAPGFSITPETPWAFEILVQEGFTIDASVFPARRGHGGWPDFHPHPCLIKTESGTLFELPATITRLGPFRLAFSGGGYLRLLPYSLIKRATRWMNESGHPVVFYIHPREIDPHHPRLPMNLLRRFKSYVRLSSTMPKLRKILSDFRFSTLLEWVESLDKERICTVDLTKEAR